MRLEPKGWSCGVSISATTGSWMRSRILLRTNSAYSSLSSSLVMMSRKLLNHFLKPGSAHNSSYNSRRSSAETSSPDRESPT